MNVHKYKTPLTVIKKVEFLYIKLCSECEETRTIERLKQENNALKLKYFA